MKKSLCEISNPKQWKTISTDMLKDEGYPVYGANGIIGYYSEYNHEEKTLLITCRGATCGSLNICEPYSYVNGNAMALDNLIEEIDIHYLYYYLLNRGLKDTITGTAQPQIVRQSLQKVYVEYPELEVQCQIVNKLNQVTNLINKRKKQLEKLDKLVKTRSVELFGSKENKIHISEMCNVTGGYSFKSGDISNDGAIKILQIGNVYLDNVNWETTNYLPEGYDEKYSKFMLNEGDIVVALTRPIIQSLGNVKACIVKSSDLPCLLNQRVGRIVAKNEKTVFLEFIYGCLMTDDFTRYVETCSIGCSQPNISTKDIENYLIPNATYEEQKAYVEFKKQTDKSKEEVQKSLEKLELLKKALMQKYFG